MQSFADRLFVIVIMIELRSMSHYKYARIKYKYSCELFNFVFISSIDQMKWVQANNWYVGVSELHTCTQILFSDHTDVPVVPIFKRLDKIA